MTEPVPDPRSRPDDDIDARFEQIVAGLSLTTPDQDGDGSSQSFFEGIGSREVRPDVVSPETATDSAQPSTVNPSPPRLMGFPDARAAWRGYAPAEEDKHFEPPEPDLPPAHDATYWIAVMSMVLGPLLIVWAAFLSHNPDPGWWIVGGIVLTVMGFALVIVRDSGERDPDDDGARV